MEKEKDGATAEVVLELLEHMRSNGIDVWLHGGWALEATVGKSRPHTDIDMMAFDSARKPIRRLFTNHILAEDIHKYAMEFGPAYVEVSFFTPIRDMLVTPTPRVLFFWPPDTVTHKHPAQLLGTPVPAVSPSALWVEIANTLRKKKPMLDRNAVDREAFGDLLDQETKESLTRYFPRENNFLNRMRLRFGL